MRLSRQILHYVVVIVVQALALLLPVAGLSGLLIDSPSAAIWVIIAYALAQALFWWLFVNVFSRLPIWLYPILTFGLSGGMVAFVGNLIPGIEIDGIRTGVWIVMILTSVSTVLGGFLSLDLVDRLDGRVVRAFVAKHGNVQCTPIPGFLYLEIDGLGEGLLRRALSDGRMPTLQRWVEGGTHTIRGWETDYSSQTGAAQSGILLGHNHDVPAYRWLDRESHRTMQAGNPLHAASIEARLSTGNGLLSDGGASRGNMFSGDASESLFTIGTVLDRARAAGPGFYLYLVNPWVVARLLTRYAVGVMREWRQAFLQKARRDPHRVRARNVGYAFVRAAVCELLQEMVTYVAINDVLRGLPAIYALYGGYDDVGHFAGMASPSALGTLEEIDRYFARIERALADAPRPYHIIVLSDHGQTDGGSFQAAYDTSLDRLVRDALNGESRIYASLDSDESWENVRALLTESMHGTTRTAQVVRTLLQHRVREGMVMVGPDRDRPSVDAELAEIRKSDLIILSSGCAGLIYVTGSAQRVTYEKIQDRFPDLILRLTQHPGIGFLLVHSQEHGGLVFGRRGIYFLDLDEYDGVNPLADYGPNAARLLRRESGYPSCPDILVNTVYDPETDEMPSFENQVSHHGGLGGPQNHPFLCHPVELPIDAQPLVGATAIYRVLRTWREATQEEHASSCS